MLRYVALIVFALALTACSSNSLPPLAKDLPAGDAVRGADLFKQAINGAPACATCHTVDGTTLVGPSLQGLGAAAGTRVSGHSAPDYVFQSITRPAAYIVSGYGNLMYNQYAQHLDGQQLADLIAYVLSR